MTARKSPRETYRRLTAAEAHARGVSPKAKHYVRANVKHITRQTKTITERSYRNQLTQYETGEKISREKLSSLRKSGEKQYASEKTKQTAELNSRLAKIRRQVKGVSPQDAREMDDFLHNNGRKYFANMTGKQRQAKLKILFDRYSYREVLEALGSPIETKVKRAS